MPPLGSTVNVPRRSTATMIDSEAEPATGRRKPGLVDRFLGTEDDGAGVAPELTVRKLQLVGVGDVADDLVSATPASIPSSVTSWRQATAAVKRAVRDAADHLGGPDGGLVRRCRDGHGGCPSCRSARAHARPAANRDGGRRRRARRTGVGRQERDVLIARSGHHDRHRRREEGAGACGQLGRLCSWLTPKARTQGPAALVPLRPSPPRGAAGIRRRSR